MKYRFFCETCNQVKCDESLIIRPICDIASGHVIRLDSLTIIPNEATKDYKKLRAELISYVMANQENLTTEELRIASEHFVVPTNIRNMFFTLEEQMEMGKEFHRKSVESRRKRMNACIMECFNRLPLSNTYEMLADMDGGQLVNNYIEYGLEGTLVGDPPGIYDYLQSTNIYANEGLLLKNWSPLGMSMQNLSDRLMDILVNGNYTL